MFFGVFDEDDFGFVNEKRKFVSKRDLKCDCILLLIIIKCKVIYRFNDY